MFYKSGYEKYLTESLVRQGIEVLE